MSLAARLNALAERVAAEFNQIRQEISDAPATFDNATFSGTTAIGSSNSDIVRARALEVEVDTRAGTVGYTGSDVTTITEKNGATTIRTTTVGYSSGRVSTITEVVGATTVTTTLSYDGAGNFTGWSKTVSP